jgi:hypothetical protein
MSPLFLWMREKRERREREREKHVLEEEEALKHPTDWLVCSSSKCAFSEETVNSSSRLLVSTLHCSSSSTLKFDQRCSLIWVSCGHVYYPPSEDRCIKCMTTQLFNWEFYWTFSFAFIPKEILFSFIHSLSPLVCQSVCTGFVLLSQ